VHPQFRVDRLVHRYMFTNCLKAMSNHLRRDMCDLKSPGALATKIDRREVDRHIPLHVQSDTTLVRARGLKMDWKGGVLIASSVTVFTVAIVTYTRPMKGQFGNKFEIGGTAVVFCSK